MPRIKKLKQPATPAATLPVDDLKRLLHCASKDATRPVLMHVWIAGDDAYATDTFCLVVHPGLGAGVPDGGVPRAAIEFAKQQRTPQITVEAATVTVKQRDGDVVFQRPEGTPPDYKELVNAMVFDGSHQLVNAELLLNVQRALNARAVKVTRGKQQRSPLLITREGGATDVPYAVLMPVLSHDPGGDE